jgi:hypothetical protein
MMIRSDSTARGPGASWGFSVGSYQGWLSGTNEFTGRYPKILKLGHVMD